jgi:hypothetical protein
MNLSQASFPIEKRILQSALDYLYADRVYLISAKTIKVYGKLDDVTLDSWLQEWATEGRIKILNSIQTSENDDICIELLKFIGK